MTNQRTSQIFDPMGQAMHDYYFKKKTNRLIIKTDVAEDEPLSIPYLFRNFDKMPVLEQKALQMCSGSILDVGAGAGVHSVWLQEHGFQVTALEFSPLMVEVLQHRGIKNSIKSDFHAFTSEQPFDTILFLMNGVGVAQSIERLPQFFEKCKSLMHQGSQILLDSSDLIYLYGDEEDGYFIDLMGNYYGEVTYQLKYGKMVSEPFPWLFIDFYTLEEKALQAGFNCTMVAQGSHFDYLAKLSWV